MLHTDQPIETSKEDILGRLDFARNLAESVIFNKPKNCLTLGLYGSWGSGKTSVLNLFEEEIATISKDLSDKNKPIIINYNPWLVSDQEQLLSQFFKELSHAINSSAFSRSNNKLSNLLEKYAHLFNVGSYAPNLSIGSKFISFVLSCTSRLIKKDNRDILSEVREKLFKELLKIDYKIIVLVDDIDRLDVHEIRQVFKLIKVIADFPNTIYILSFDRDIVTKALEEVHKGNGLHYLEKIVQIPFEIPEISLDKIYSLFFSKLENIIELDDKDSLDIKHWSIIFQEGISYWISNVRDVNRISNAFSLKYSLVKGEIDIADLLAITTLEIFEPEVYTEIKKNKDLLAGGGQYTLEKRDEDKNKNLVQEIIKLGNEKNQGYIKNIICEMFPRISMIMNPLRPGYYDDKYSLKRSMIRNPECFDRYFRLSFHDDSVPKSLARAILYNFDRTEIERELNIVNEEGKIISLIQILRAYLKEMQIEDIGKERVQMLLEIFFLNWNIFNNPEKSKFFAMPFAWRLIQFSKDLLTILEESDRFQVSKSIITNSKISLNLRVLQLKDFKNMNQKNNNSDEFISNEEIIELDFNLYNEIERRSKNIDDFELLDAIHFWDEKNHDKAKEFINQVLSTDAGLVKLVSRFVGVGKVSSDIVYDTYIIHKERFEKYCSIEDINERIKKMLHDDLHNQFTPVEIQKIIFFSISVEDNDFDGKPISEIEKEYQKKLAKWEDVS